MAVSQEDNPLLLQQGYGRMRSLKSETRKKSASFLTIVEDHDSVLTANSTGSELVRKGNEGKLNLKERVISEHRRGAVLRVGGLHRQPRLGT